MDVLAVVLVAGGCASVAGINRTRAMLVGLASAVALLLLVSLW